MWGLSISPCPTAVAQNVLIQRSSLVCSPVSWEYTECTGWSEATILVIYSQTSVLGVTALIDTILFPVFFLVFRCSPRVPSPLAFQVSSLARFVTVRSMLPSVSMVTLGRWRRTRWVCAEEGCTGLTSGEISSVTRSSARVCLLHCGPVRFGILETILKWGASWWFFKPNQQFLYELGMFENRHSILEKKYFCNKGVVPVDPPFVGQRPHFYIFWDPSLI